MIWTFKVQKAPKPFYQIQMWEEGGAVVREILRSLHKLLQKTDTETFLCEDTVPAGNNWGQTVELNESLILVSSHDQQRALDQAVKKQEHEHMNMMFSCSHVLTGKYHLHAALPTSDIKSEI